MDVRVCYSYRCNYIYTFATHYPLRFPLLNSLTQGLKRTGNDQETEIDEVELGELIENIQGFRNFREL